MDLELAKVLALLCVSWGLFTISHGIRQLRVELSTVRWELGRRQRLEAENGRDGAQTIER